MADVLIEVRVTGERLTLLNQPVLAAGTVKAVKINFVFDDVWDGYSKIALFWNESDEVYAWQVINDLATVPHEVVVSSGRLRFGVYGIKGTNRIVTEKVFYDIADGAYTSVYDESTEPTPGILDQIEAMLAAQGESIQALGTSIQGIQKHLTGIDGAIFFEKTVITASASFAVDDAVEGLAPVSLSEGLTIYSRNMYRANIASRTSRGVTFTADPDDPNTVTIDGTATEGGAFSYGTITTQTAMNLLEAGTYYLAYYDDETHGVRPNRLWNPYINVIDYETGQSVVAEWMITYGINVITLTAKSYVGIRVAVAAGKTVSNVTAHIYLSKYPPLPEYIPYKTPGVDVMYEHAVVEGDASGSITYRAYAHDDMPVKLSVATFNVGGYNNGGSGSADTLPSFDAYRAFIGSLDADLLCTQEDRIKYDSETLVFDKLYALMYRYYGVPSYSSSSTYYAYAKGIYSDYPVSPCGAYTFVNSGTSESGESVWSSFSYRFLYINHKTILLISTHLAAHDNNTAARKLQVQEMLDFIAASRCDHIIMCGDFNVWEDELDPIKDRGYILANCGIFGQFNTFSRGEHPFDNIIVSPNLRLRNVHVVENDLQDHYALTADVIID